MARDRVKVHTTERRALDAFRARRHLCASPTSATDNCADDVALACERLSNIGVSEVVVVDLTKADVGIPVVRVIVPGLEGLHDAPGYVAGPRARRAAARSTA